MAKSSKKASKNTNEEEVSLSVLTSLVEQATSTTFSANRKQSTRALMDAVSNVYQEKRAIEDKCRKLVDQAEENANNAVSRLQDMEAKYAPLATKVLNLKQQLQDTEQARLGTEETVARLQSELQQARLGSEGESQRNRELREQIKRQEELLAKAREASSKYQNDENTMIDLRREINDAKHERESLMKSFEAEREAKVRAQKVLLQLNERNYVLMKSVADSERKANEASQALDGLKEQLALITSDRVRRLDFDRVVAELAQAQQELKYRCSHWEEEKLRSKEDALKMARTSEDLTRRLAESTAQRQTLEKEKWDAQRELENRIAELARVEKDLAHTSERSQTFERKLRDATQQAAESRQDATHLSERVRSLNQKNQTLEEQLKDYLFLKDRAHTLESQVNEISQANSSFQHTTQQLRRELSDKTDELQKCQKTLSDLQRRNSSLNDELLQETEELKATRSSLSHETALRTKLERVLADRDATIADKERCLSEQHAQSLRLSRDLQSLEQALVVAREERVAMENSLQQLDQNRQATMRRIQAELERKTKEASQARRMEQQLRAENASLSSQVQIYSRTVDSFTQPGEDSGFIPHRSRQGSPAKNYLSHSLNASLRPNTGTPAQTVPGSDTPKPMDSRVPSLSGDTTEALGEIQRMLALLHKQNPEIMSAS